MLLVLPLTMMWVPKPRRGGLVRMEGDDYGAAHTM